MSMITTITSVKTKVPNANMTFAISAVIIGPHLLSEDIGRSPCYMRLWKNYTTILINYMDISILPYPNILIEKKPFFLQS